MLSILVMRNRVPPIPLGGPRRPVARAPPTGRTVSDPRAPGATGPRVQGGGGACRKPRRLMLAHVRAFLGLFQSAGVRGYLDLKVEIFG